MKATRRHKRRVSHVRQTRRRLTRMHKPKPKVDYFIPLNTDTRVMILYISYRNYLKMSKRIWSIDEILNDANGYIRNEHYMFGLKLKERAEKNKLRHLSMTEFNNLMKKSVGNKKKYKYRPSPPFSASPLCGYILTGGDGKAYESVRIANGTCVWKPTLETAYDTD